MTSSPTLAELRLHFARQRPIAVPIAGAICWAVAGVFGAVLPVSSASIAMFICVGMIFPLSLLVGRVVHENVMARDELSDLLFKSIMAASLFWAVVIPFYIVDRSSVPLTLGIIFGVPWMILGWIIRHWIGSFHAIARTVLIVVAWFLLPEYRFVAIPGIIVIIYLISILVLATRTIGEPSQGNGA